MTPVAASRPILATPYTLEARLARLGVVHAASHASSSTRVPIAPIEAARGEAVVRRAPAHVLDIRV